MSTSVSDTTTAMRLRAARRMECAQKYNAMMAAQPDLSVKPQSEMHCHLTNGVEFSVPINGSFQPVNYCGQVIEAGRPIISRLLDGEFHELAGPAVGDVVLRRRGKHFRCRATANPDVLLRTDPYDGFSIVVGQGRSDEHMVPTTDDTHLFAGRDNHYTTVSPPRISPALHRSQTGSVRNNQAAVLHSGRAGRRSNSVQGSSSSRSSAASEYAQQPYPQTRGTISRASSAGRRTPSYRSDTFTSRRKQGQNDVREENWAQPIADDTYHGPVRLGPVVKPLKQKIGRQQRAAGVAMSTNGYDHVLSSHGVPSSRNAVLSENEYKRYQQLAGNN